MGQMAKDREGIARDYLGDGVYAVHDGFGIWLTAEDGVRATDTIYLEPGVFAALEHFVGEVIARRRARASETETR